MRSNPVERLGRGLARRIIRNKGVVQTQRRAQAAWSKIYGWPLQYDVRMSIDNPGEYIQQELLLKRVYEPNISRVIAAVLRPGDLFVDVGANIGYHSLVAARCGACVHSFEPLPRLARRLDKNLRLNGLHSLVTVTNSALGNEPGEATLFAATRFDDGSHSLIPGVPADSVEPVTVPVTTLDLHLREALCGVPTLIKIDVEGYEARVLDGASRALDSPCAPIILIETGDRLACQIGESASKVLDRLFRRGFRIFQLSAVRSIEVFPDAISGELMDYCAIQPGSPRFASVMTAIGPGAALAGELTPGGSAR